MISKLGIYALIVGFFMGVFAGISRFMKAQNFWVDLTISKFIGEEKSESIVLLFDVEAIQNILDFLIYELPLFGHLIGMGVVLLIISMFLKDH